MANHAKPPRRGPQLVLAASAVFAVTAGTAVTMAVRGDDKPTGQLVADSRPPSTSSAPPAPPLPVPSVAVSAPSATPTTPPTSRPAAKPTSPAAVAKKGSLTGQRFYVDRTGAAVKQLQ